MISMFNSCQGTTSPATNPGLLGPFSLPPAERLQQCRQRSAASGAAGDLGTARDLGGSAALFQSDSHWEPVTELLFLVLSCFYHYTYSHIYNLTVTSIYTCVYMCVNMFVPHFFVFFPSYSGRFATTTARTAVLATEFQ